MKLLQQAFREVKQATTQAWSHKKNFNTVLPLLFLLSIIPVILAVHPIDHQNTTILFLMLSTSIIAVFASIFFNIAITVGVVARIKEFLGSGDVNVKKVYAVGVKKLIPNIVIGIYALLPLFAVAGLGIAFEQIPMWILVVLGIFALGWAVLVNFANLYFLIDNNRIHQSLFKSAVLVAKNIANLIVRFIVAFVLIIFPVIIITSIVDGISLSIIKNYYQLPSFEVVSELIKQGLLPPFGGWVHAVAQIINSAFSTFVIFPIGLVYVYNIFVMLKQKSEPSERAIKKTEYYATWMYGIIAVVSVAVLVKTIFF